MAIDRATNRISLFNVVEGLQSDHAGIVLQEMVALSVWIFEPTELEVDHQLQIVVHLPDGGTRGPYKQNFTAKAVRHRLVTSFEQFDFDQAGDWVFRVCLDGDAKTSASHTVTIRHSQTETAA